MSTRALSILVLLASACAAPEEDELEEDFYEDLDSIPADEGKADGPQYVRDYFRRTCTTAVLLPLARQIADRMVCLEPGAFKKVAPTTRIQIVGGAVLPYLDVDALTALKSAASQGVVQISSGFRTLPQQVLIRFWAENGLCRIGAAATPGRSNHETGRALDLENWGGARSIMKSNGWTHSIEVSPRAFKNDPFHYEHLRSDDHRGLDVVAFQQLWNDNNPQDPIDVSGVYDNETARRVRIAPAKGFARAECRSQNVAPTDPNDPADPMDPPDDGIHPTLGPGFNRARVDTYVPSP
jgi:hypothetical protein